MRSKLKQTKFIAVFLTVLLIPAFLSAQDLGSTSGLFSTKTAKKSTAKKKTSKKKTTSPKRTSKKSKTKSARKKTTAKSSKSRSSKRSTRGTVAKKTSKRTPVKSGEKDPATTVNNKASRPEDIVILVGAPDAADALEQFDNSIALGNAARNRRLYTQAEAAYKKAKSLNPDDSRAIYGLGNIYSDQQRWEQAEEAYRKALAIEPDNPLANIALSFVLTQPVVGSNLGERYSEADEKARKAIELDPQNAVGYDQLGVAMELRGIISDETEQAYRKAIDLDPTFALAYSHLGRLLRRKGLTNESSASYKQAITLATDVPTMILVADVMQSQQRFLDSEELLREALRRDPRNPTGLYLLGRALTTRKSFAEAEEILKKSVSVSPNSFVSYALLGSLYSQSGDLSKAEQTLVEALSVITDNEKRRLAQEFEEVGDGLFKKRRYQDAARLFRRAIALDAEKSSLEGKLAAAESNK